MSGHLIDTQNSRQTTTAGAALWLSWERQRRNRSMAARLGAQLFELEHVGGRLARYISLSCRTFALLREQRPAVVYFQNPSIVLATLVTLMKSTGLLRAKTVGDFHNAGVFPSFGAWLVPWLVRSNDLIIVSNEELRARVEALGGRCLAIPDPLPHIDAHPRVIPRE